MQDIILFLEGQLRERRGGVLEQRRKVTPYIHRDLVM